MGGHPEETAVQTKRGRRKDANGTVQAGQQGKPTWACVVSGSRKNRSAGCQVWRCQPAAVATIIQCRAGQKKQQYKASVVSARRKGDSRDPAAAGSHRLSSHGGVALWSQHPHVGQRAVLLIKIQPIAHNKLILLRMGEQAEDGHGQDELRPSGGGQASQQCTRQSSAVLTPPSPPFVAGALPRGPKIPGA